MMKRIKTIIVLALAIVLAAFYATGCLPGGLNLFSAGTDSVQENTAELQQGSAEEDTESDIDKRLNELKEGLISSPVVLSHVSGEQIFGSGDSELIFLRGSAEIGNTVEIYVNGMLEQEGIQVDSNGIFETLNGVEIIEGSNIVELIAVNPSGRRSGPTKFSLELIVPQKVEYAIYNNSTDMVEIEGAYYASESKPEVYLRGTYLPGGSSIFIQANDRIIGEAISGTTGLFELDGIVLDTGANEVAVWAITPDGYISAPMFESITIFKDMITPYPSNLTGYQNGNVNYISWDASVDDNFSAYKIVRVEDPCVNPDYPGDDVIVTINNQNTKSYIDDDLETGRSYYYTVWTLDKAGHVVSSNVLAIPKPVYTISISKLDSFSDISVNRREWFYQYYEITNTGNVTLDLQPIMLWIKLNPEPDPDMEIAPLWEVHIWEPDTGLYYYSNEDIDETYISDWWNLEGYTTTEEVTTLSADGLTRTVTVTEITKKTENNEVNLKRIMSTTTVTTVTVTTLATGASTVTTTTATTTEIVGPERIGTLIMGLDPGEKIKIGVKIQNVSAANNEEIVVHFHFAPVDCGGHFYIDEVVSTLDIYCKSSDRN